MASKDTDLIIISSAKTTLYLQSLIRQSMEITQIFSLNLLLKKKYQWDKNLTTILLDLDYLKDLTLKPSLKWPQQTLVIGMSRTPEKLDELDELKEHFLISNILALPANIEDLQLDNWAGASFLNAFKKCWSRSEHHSEHQLVGCSCHQLSSDATS